MEPKRHFADLQEAFRQLKVENERLREENKHLKGEATRDDEHANGNIPQAFRFLDLPKDIRVMIYDLCLVRGRITIRNPIKDVCMAPHDPREPEKKESRCEVPRKDFDIPSQTLPLQLFQVNRQIYCEAAPIFLSKNHFVIPHTQGDFPTFKNRRSTKGVFVYEGMAKQYIRSLSISLHCHTYDSDLEGSVRDRGYLDRKSQLPGTWGTETEAEWLQRVHDDSIDNLCYSAWSGLKDAVEVLTLKYLEVDLTDCYCGFSCHRLVLNALYEFWYWAPGPPDLTEIIGTASDEERQSIRQLLEPTEEDGVMPKIRFRNYRKFWLSPDGKTIFYPKKCYWYDPEQEGDSVPRDGENIKGMQPVQDS